MRDVKGDAKVAKHDGFGQPSILDTNLPTKSHLRGNEDTSGPQHP
jgi:hypothetical protein